jgi:hypothetical protein
VVNAAVTISPGGWKKVPLLNPLIISLVVFLVILAGAFAGWGQTTPAGTSSDGRGKELVSVSMAVVATLSAR